MLYRRRRTLRPLPEGPQFDARNRAAFHVDDVATLLVEQKLSIALDISKRVYVMGHGRIVFEGTPAELKANDTVRREWLEV